MKSTDPEEIARLEEQERELERNFAFQGYFDLDKLAKGNEKKFFLL